jgi:hypothetical protein
MDIIVFIPVKIDKTVEIPKILEDQLNYQLLNYNTDIKNLEPYDEEFYNYEQPSINKEINNINESKKYNIVLNNKLLKVDVDKLNNSNMIKHQNENIMNKCIKCWWCCYNFNNEPIYIPNKYENNVFEVYGNFCSFPCALSYNYNDPDLDKSMRNEVLIYTFYNKLYNNDNKEVDKINYAPPKELLIDFGGKLSIEEYRANNVLYNIIYPPISITIPYLEKIKVRENSIEEKDEDDDYVLKRTKNKKRKNTIFSLMKK